MALNDKTNAENIYWHVGPFYADVQKRSLSGAILCYSYIMRYTEWLKSSLVVESLLNSVLPGNRDLSPLGSSDKDDGTIHQWTFIRLFPEAMAGRNDTDFYVRRRSLQSIACHCRRATLLSICFNTPLRTGSTIFDLRPSLKRKQKQT